MEEAKDSLLTIELGWQPATGGVVEQKPSDLSIGEWSRKCRRLFKDGLRFNELTKDCEYNNKPVSCEFIDELYVVLGELGWTISKEKARDVFAKIARENPFNPIREYLEKVVLDPKIIAADLSKLSSTYFKTDDLLADEMLRKWLIGAVQRIMEAGSQMDYVLVLKGKQGLKKSTGLRTLCRGYFCDTLATSDKDLALALGTCWFFSFEELESFTASKMTGQIKNLITIREDRYRPPYGAVTGKYPRSSVFCASVNDDSFLKDSTGSRRFWVIEITEEIDIKQLEKDLDQIWKAVMAAYRMGEEPRLSKEGEAHSERRNSRFEDDDPYALDAYEFINNLYCPSEFSAMQVLMNTGLQPEKSKITKQNLRDMGNTLKSLGCIKTKQRRVDGSRQHMWTKPEMNPQNDSTALKESDSMSTPKDESEQSIMDF